MRNPWKGLASYQEKDNEKYKFCGRGNSIRELARLIQNNLFVTLYGRTGIGKTSLLQAGVFPIFRRRDFLPVVVRFSDMKEDDNHSYAEYIISMVETEIEKNGGFIKEEEAYRKEDSKKDNDILWRYFASRRFYILKNNEEREVFPVVVLDQFEENLLASSEREKAWTLMRQLYSLIDDNKIFPPGYHDETNFRIVVSIREDDLFRLEDCIDYNKLTEFKYNRYRLVPLTEEEATEIVEVPGEEILPITAKEREQVVQKILGLVKGENGENMSTLMLSLVCHLLFESINSRNTPGIITAEVIGNLNKNNLLENFYLNVVKDIPEKERNYIEDTLVDSHRRRNFVNREEFIENCGCYQQLAKGNNRILQENNSRIELVHDILASTIFHIRERRKEEERIKELEKRQAEERRKNRRKLLIMLAIVVVAGIGAIFAWQAFNVRKWNNQLQLFQSRAIATQAIELIENGDSYTATLLALEALPKDLNNPDRPYCDEAEDALRRAMMRDNAIIDIGSGVMGSGVKSVAFSPDGKRIVSGSYDYTIRIWDAETGSLIGQPLKCHEVVYSVAFSPDGKRIVSGSSNNTLRIWDAESGKQIGQSLQGHTGEVYSVAFSPDGKRIVSGSGDNTIQIWDSKTGTKIGEPMKGHNDKVGSVAFSPDGKRIVSGSDDWTIRIWNAETGERIGLPLTGHKGSVGSVAFSPDGKQIVSGSSDNTLRIWDTDSGKLIGQPLEGHATRVYSVAFSPDGKRIVSGSSDQTLRIWDAKTGKQMGQWGGHQASVLSVAFSPDGKRIVSGSYDNTLRIWDASPLQELIDKARERFKNRKLTAAERRKYYLD